MRRVLVKCFFSTPSAEKVTPHRFDECVAQLGIRPRLGLPGRPLGRVWPGLAEGARGHADVGGRSELQLVVSRAQITPEPFETLLALRVTRVDRGEPVSGVRHAAIDAALVVLPLLCADFLLACTLSGRRGPCSPHASRCANSSPDRGSYRANGCNSSGIGHRLSLAPRLSQRWSPAPGLATPASHAKRASSGHAPGLAPWTSSRSYGLVTDTGSDACIPRGAVASRPSGRVP